MIQIENVSFSWGPDNPCLQNISAQINSGELCAVMGPNGSGKTTLLSIMLGYLQHESGTVNIDGIKSSDYQRKDLIKKIGYVSQSVYLPFNLTVHEYVQLGRISLPESNEGNSIEDVLKQTGIEHLGDRGVQELSGGEKQLAAIARCLYQTPEILLLDEPVSHLDPLHRKQIFSLLKKLSTDGYTVVCTCHDPLYASLYSSTCIGLKSGRVLFSGPSNIELNTDNLSSLYGMEFDTVEYEGKMLPMEKI